MTVAPFVLTLMLHALASQTLDTAQVSAPPALEPAPNLTALARTDFQYAPADAAAPINIGRLPQEPATETDISSNNDNALRSFGETESTYWSVKAALAVGLHEHNLAQAGVGAGYFIADGLSLDAEFNFMYINQEDDDAAGFNVNLLLRWHFYQNEARTWSLYADGGAGLLVTTTDVPSDGSSFNFVPQFGGGASFDIGEGRRLFTGARWHHISNANLYEENPGLDAVMVYAMVSFPF